MPVLNPRMPNYTETDATAAKNTFIVAGGAAGWVDTDISGSDVPAGNVLIVFQVYPLGDQAAGARTSNAIGGNGNISSGKISTLVSGQTSARHVYLYRGAANNEYRILGYFS